MSTEIGRLVNNTRADPAAFAAALERAGKVFDEWEYAWRKKDVHAKELSDPATDDLLGRLATALAEAEGREKARCVAVVKELRDGDFCGSDIETMEAILDGIEAGPTR